MERADSEGDMWPMTGEPEGMQARGGRSSDWCADRCQALLILVLVLSSGLLLPVATRADERATAHRFELAKRDAPSLIAFLKAMPKGGDLHVHVGGAVYAESGLDNAIRQGLFFDPATSQFERENAPGRVPAASLLDDEAGTNLSRYLDAVSMRGWRPAIESGHDHFFRTFGIIGSARQGMSGDDALAEVIDHARAQNEQYLELMTGVAPGDAWAKVMDALPGVEDPEKALAILQPRLEGFVLAARKSLDARDQTLAKRLGVTPPITGVQGPLTIRYIVAASRLAPDNEFFATLAAGMALMRVDPRVVGVNILAPEDHPIARTHFETQMRLLDFLWQHFDHPHITLHAGELTPTISPLAPMRSRIRRSIEVGHAQRIGHGVSIAWEDDLSGLFQEMRQKGVAVEICLTSNDGILGVRDSEHPFHLYRRAGIPVSLNTDDEGVNRSNLTLEFVRAVRSYNLSYQDVKTLVRNSIEYAFLPGQSLYQDHNPERLRSGFADVRKLTWRPSPEAEKVMGASEKLRVQVRLERALTAFENGTPLP
jgi:adenosine deaminase